MSIEKKERSFTLRLNDRDMRRLYIKAGQGGMTPGELLESFVRDLVCSDQSNGSDERECAYAWYDRCGFEMLAKRGFLSYMLRYESVKDAVKTWELLQAEEQSIAKGVSNYADQEEFEAAKEDARYWREELEGYYRNYQMHCDVKGEGLEKEMEDLVEWYEGLLKLEKGS